MTPAAIQLIIQGVLAAIGAAPQIEGVIKSIHDWIDSLAAKKIIDAAKQDALHKFVDANAAMDAAGIKPIAWTVEPDPT